MPICERAASRSDMLKNRLGRFGRLGRLGEGDCGRGNLGSPPKPPKPPLAFCDATMPITLRDLLGDGKVHVLDGAMGTMLYAKGFFLNVCYDELNLKQPKL